MEVKRRWNGSEENNGSCLRLWLMGSRDLGDRVGLGTVVL